MKLDQLITSEEVLERELKDPEFRAEWERLSGDSCKEVPLQSPPQEQGIAKLVAKSSYGKARMVVPMVKQPESLDRSESLGHSPAGTRADQLAVLTIDQRRSRSTEPAAEALAIRLNSEFGERVERPFEVTVGDELQGIVADAATAIEIVFSCMRDWRRWWIGIGLGSVERPLAESARFSSGAAFQLAREAVIAAKTLRSGVAVRAADAELERPAEALLSCLAYIYERRGDPVKSGRWKAVNLARGGLTMEEIGRRLDISHQAVSSRLRIAGWREEQEIQWLTAKLMDQVLTGYGSRIAEVFGDLHGE